MAANAHAAVGIQLPLLAGGDHRESCRKDSGADSEADSGGFVFDPERAFEEFDLSGVKSPELRGNIREASEIEFGSQVSFSGAPTRNEFRARFEAKEFHSFEEEKLEPASK